MSQWTPGRVRASGESYLRAAGHARHQALLGRSAPSAAEIRERFDFDLGRDALDVALEQVIDAAAGTDDACAARVLLGWLAGLEIARTLAPVERWIAEWRAGAVVRTAEAQAVRFDDARRMIGREPSRSARASIDGARTALIARELLATLVDRDARWRESVEALDLADSLAESIERVSGIDLDAVAARARAGLGRSADVWHDTLAAALEHRASLTLAEARYSDLLYALGTDAVDGAFGASRRLDIARRAVDDLGLGRALESRLTIELGPALDAREHAECVAVDVPHEVRVVIGSAGGLRASDVALEETGRALHLAHTDPDAPFELRWLGDPGARGMCGRILASLLVDRTWLARQLGLSRTEAATAARAAALVALHDLRRACGATLYRAQWLRSELAYGAAQEMYVATMAEAVTIAPHPVDALFDAPPSLAPASRMRAIEGAAALVEELVDRFDVDWYRNPRCGPWLAQHVFGAARGRLAEEVVTRATGREPSLTRYIEHLEMELGR